MIPYIQVIGKYTLKPFAVVEPSECWLELSYFDEGEFEVYAAATQNNLNALQMGNYVMIPNKPYLWVIKSINYTFNADGARVISAKGKEAKDILHNRVILNPYQLETNLAIAVYNMLLNNMGANAISQRKIIGFNVIQPTFNISLSDTQASREDIGEFLKALLKANGCGAYTTFENNQITYRAIQGRNLSASILFSQSMDNLLTADYYQSSEEKKTFCRVVSTFSKETGTGDNKQTIDVDYVKDYDQGATGIDRREMVVNSNLSTKLEDGTEVDPSTSLYQSFQLQEGKNQLAERIVKKEFNGEIDLKYSNLVFGQDFFIGDMVKVRDEYFGYEDTTRITKYRFKQDSSGYGEEVEYGNE